MRKFKVFAVLFIWSVCFCGVCHSSTKVLGLFFSDAVGFAPLNKTISLVSQAKHLSESAGMGFGSSAILNEWQKLHSEELEHLLANNHRDVL